MLSKLFINASRAVSSTVPLRVFTGIAITSSTVDTGPRRCGAEELPAADATGFLFTAVSILLINPPDHHRRHDKNGDGKKSAYQHGSQHTSSSFKSHVVGVIFFVVFSFPSDTYETRSFHGK